MNKWRCIPCDYIYDPVVGDEDGGITTGAAFEELPEDLWLVCGVVKEEFEKEA